MLRIVVVGNHLSLSWFTENAIVTGERFTKWLSLGVAGIPSDFITLEADVAAMGFTRQASVGVHDTPRENSRDVRIMEETLIKKTLIISNYGF